MKIISELYSENSLMPLYFETEIIDRYFKNPKYVIYYSDYRGSISLSSEHFDENHIEKYEVLKNFGLAYHKITGRRAIVCFAGDIVKLPRKAQLLWQCFLIDNQYDYKMNDGFYKNLIEGEWVEDISIYQALLMEIHTINLMCISMRLPIIYNVEYKYNSNQYTDRPIHFHNILFPTRDNYFNFINTLEKIVINNINYKCFTKDSFLVKKIEPKKDDGYMKGTLVMLEEWLTQNIKGGNVVEDIVNPLKELRKIRQKPAHVIYKNEYNEEIWNDQRKLMHNIYSAVRNLRLNFANHPSCSQIKVDKILFEGTNIVDY